MPSDTDRFESIRAKVERAESHMAELAEMDRAYRSVQCSLAITEDAESGISHFTFIMPSPPSTVPTIVGDCLNNLRSSLDHLIWQIVASNDIAQPSKENMFPICMSEGAFSGQIRGNRLRGVPQDAIDQIERLQPYVGQHNSLLALLSKLCNMDKHQDLHYCVSIASDVSFVASRNGVQILHMVIGNDEIRNGEVFGGIGFDPKLLDGLDVDIRGHANAYIGFRDLQSDFDETLRVTETLGEMAQFVKYEAIDSLWDYVSHGSA